MEFTKAQMDINNEIRMLWEQHGFWTRSAIASMALNLPDEDFVVERLFQNPKDFARALKPLYGDKIAAKFRDLLAIHLAIAAQIVKAAKAGDDSGASDAEEQWYANADEIADFLGRINPYWSQKDWKRMMHKHLELVKAEAVNLLTKDFKASIKVYDEIERQALEMADVMSEGIIKQFSI
ncbi:MAG: hypothetical protein K0S75_1238 [Clostridia bacterium]|jgi:hypothetical protein|nr:hypothetical protein [Clostridia bacterium]